jgi:hypothetical protein
MPDLANWGQYGEICVACKDRSHISLTCKNHPELRWSTKNISPIGARNIYFEGSRGQLECKCSIKDLIHACPKPLLIDEINGSVIEDDMERDRR